MNVDENKVVSVTKSSKKLTFVFKYFATRATFDGFELFFNDDIVILCGGFLLIRLSLGTTIVQVREYRRIILFSGFLMFNARFARLIFILAIPQRHQAYSYRFQIVEFIMCRAMKFY